MDDAPRSFRGRMSAPASVTALAVGLAMTGALSACSGTTDDVVYCVDQNNQIVDDSKCDDSTGTSNNGLFWYMVGRYGSGLQPGTRLDPAQGQRVSPRDQAARERAGIPRTGKVSTGKTGTVASKGGFGKGGTSAGKGGTGGHGGGGFGGHGGGGAS